MQMRQIMDKIQKDQKFKCHLWRAGGKKRISSVQFSRSVVSNSLRPHGLQHARLPCPSPTPRVYSNSCPFSQWCHPTISSSVTRFSSCPQSFPASGSFLISQLFASGGQNIGASASASLFPMNIQGWFSLGLTGLISLLSKGLSRVFSNTIVQKKRSSEWTILPQKSLPGSQAVQLSGHTFPWHSGMWSQVGLRKHHYKQS